MTSLVITIYWLLVGIRFRFFLLSEFCFLYVMAILYHFKQHTAQPYYAEYQCASDYGAIWGTPGSHM